MIMLGNFYKELWVYIDPALYAVGASLSLALGLAIF